MNGRIVLDATYSAGKNLSGVGVYCREILRGLTAAHPGQRFTAAFRSQRFIQSFGAPLPRNCARTLLWDGGMAGRAWIFHGLNQRMPRFESPRRCCTFHDLFVLTGEYSSPDFRERFARQARDAAERSDLVICVSQFTADQVHALLGVERSRLRVIHHGTTPRGNRGGPRLPVVLCAGALQRRKNIVRLVEAFERAAAPPWRLVLPGSPGYGAADIFARIEASSARERIETPGYVDDESLARLYSTASVFAFPSLDEGFGMPVLEAMAAGVPVLASNRSAVAEVCGDAALLACPENTDELESALRRLLTEAELRTQLTARGYARAAQFTWERAAQLTWNVYEELA